MREEELTENKQTQNMKMYLLEAQENMKRLKKGRKPKRRLKHKLMDHKKIITFGIVALIITSFIFVPIVAINNLIGINEDNPIDEDNGINEDNPIDEDNGTNDNKNLENILEANKIKNSVESKFMTEDYLPLEDLTYNKTSSSLIFLNALVHSLLVQIHRNMNDTILEEDYHKINHIFDTIVNQSFVSYYNNSIPIGIFEQFFGLYTLLQVYYALEDTVYEFSFGVIDNLTCSIVNEYYNNSLWAFMTTNSTSIKLEDQAIAIFTLSSILLTGKISSNKDFYAHVIDYTSRMIDICYYNTTTKLYAEEYFFINQTTKGKLPAKSLIFLALASDKVLKVDYYLYFSASSSSLHQHLINNYMKDWLVYEQLDKKGAIIISNQALFIFLSTLLELTTVANETLAALVKYFSVDEGYSITTTNSTITCESSLYSMLAFISYDWRQIEKEREITLHYEDRATSYIMTSIVMSMLTLTIFLRKRRKNRIRNGS